MNELVNWYFSVNERGMQFASHQVAAAVKSARLNTHLKPHCLYNGSSAEDIAWLEDQGAVVIRHEASFAKELKVGYGKNYRIFSGHWLRVDIPVIEDKEEFVLYTDIDVMFLRHPTLETSLDLLGVVSEERDGASFFNNGVMIMNVPRLKECHTAFTNAIRKRLLNDFKYPAHDQASYNRFFRGKTNEIARELNWRPYWGKNEDAEIVHFHGPKPEQVELLVRGEPQDIGENLIALWERDRVGYKYFTNLYEEIVKAA